MEIVPGLLGVVGVEGGDGGLGGVSSFGGSYTFSITIGLKLIESAFISKSIFPRNGT